MAQINLLWVPGGGTTTGQRILRIAKCNGLIPNLTTTFTPVNDYDASQAVSTAEDLQTNTIYRFKVQSLCPVGGPIDNSNGIIEDIVFECVPEDDMDTTTQTTVGLNKSVSVKIDPLPNPTGEDGGVVVANYTDITKVEFSVYDAANAVEIIAPVTVTQVAGVASWEATGLSPSTTYTLRYVLITTINGVEVRSDSISYLGNACTFEFVTDAL
jgi:hypothetical protein